MEKLAKKRNGRHSLQLVPTWLNPARKQKVLFGCDFYVNKKRIVSTHKWLPAMECYNAGD